MQKSPNEVHAIFQIIGHPDYISWCHNQKSVQHYWRQPERIELVEGVPYLTSNIYVGDFFNHGTNLTQIGIVSKKYTLMGKPSYVEGLRDSIHPTNPQYLRYECGGKMGGYLGDLWHDYGIGAITNGYFLWLPLPIQLRMAGFTAGAIELDQLTNHLVGELRCCS